MVVVLLLADVVEDLIDVPTADGEGAVAALPFEWGWRIQVFVYEIGTGAFDLLHEVGNGDRCWEGKENMAMIGQVVQGEHGATQVLELALKEALEAALDVGGDQGLAIPGGPYEV